MKKLLLMLPLFVLAGCEYHYRYPCQDPENWGKAECSNEVCKADGECTSHTLGLPDNTMPTPTWNRPPPGFGSTPKATPDSGCNAPAGRQPSMRRGASFDESEELSSEDFEDSYGKNTNKFIKKPEFNSIDKELVASKDEGQESFYREPLDLEEKPVTMNTIVNTSAHNKAASS